MEKVDEIECTSNAIGEGLNLAVSCIDADLRELDERVTCRCRECENNEVVIDLCQGHISKLERIIEAQAQTIARLEERMEEVACKCCAQDKGKGKQRAVVSNSPVLGSPIILAQSSDPEESSDSSYVTPPLAAWSLSVVTVRSVTPLQLIDEEQDVPMHPPGIGWSLTQEVLGGEDEDLIFHRRMATMAKNVQNHLGAVCGQRAYCTLGPPKHLFNPYPTVCCFLESSRQVRHQRVGEDVGTGLGAEPAV